MYQIFYINRCHYKSIFTLILINLLTSSCYFPEISLSEKDKQKIQRSLSNKVAKPQYLIQARIQDQVELLGYDLSHTQVYAGQTITITYYIKGLSNTMPDSKIFVHLQGKQKGSKSFQNLDHVPVDGLFPLKNLKKGQIVKDVQKVRIKKDFTAGTAILYWGLYQNKKRFRISNPQQVKHDGQNRVRLGSFTIKKRKRMEIKAYPLSDHQEVVIDGKMNEKAWKNAQWTRTWVHPLSGKKARYIPKTRAKFLWQSDALYIAVEAIDTHIWADYTKRDSNTWEQEVVEVFLDPDADHKNYLELQVSPRNVVFDALFLYHRSTLAKARAWNYKQWQTAVWIDGTLNQKEDQDRKYVVEMKLPIAEIPGAKLITVGTRWRINMFRFDFPKPKQAIAMALSPPFVPDFHHLDAFASLHFIGTQTQ
jgi:hypothetical protein